MNIRDRLNQSWEEMVEQDPKRDEVILATLTLLTAIFMANHLEALHKSSPLYLSLTRVAPWWVWAAAMSAAGLFQLFAALIWRTIMSRNVAALSGAFLWTVIAYIEHSAQLASWVIIVAVWQMFFQGVIYLSLKDAPPYGAVWLERRNKARRVLENIENEI